ncbi:unknown [Porcine lymphotropic herpesvirus 2]|uniref:Protein UL91 n=1 Tax=Suid gammaherpesvirus 4 TaxID=1960250 RepID=Q8B3W3_9GAMA|nr:unknown [Porcine lymphotropic herpesvirus 2]AAO12370.1 unknown [Porcine lymphotropic herpesvirus 2]
MKSQLSQNDIDECLKFFNRPFQEIVTDCASSFSSLRIASSHTQKVDVLCLILDLFGTECVQEITKLTNEHEHLEPQHTSDSLWNTNAHLDK